MKRTLGRILVGLILILPVTYAGDWLIWRVRTPWRQLGGTD